jgi:hypothetical protein
MARYNFQRSKRSPALRGPDQSLGDELPTLLVTSAVRETAAHAVQDYVQIGGRPVIEFPHGTIRK